MRFRNRSAIVTGAAGGIGQAVARAIAAEGAAVLLADIVPAEELVHEIRASGGTASDRPTDIRSGVDVAKMVADGLKQLGRIDVLVNAAGIPSHGAAMETTEAEWDRVLATNLKGTFFCCQAVIPSMRTQRYGRIINIGSVLAKNGGNARPWLHRDEQVRSGNVAYGASKAGVHAMTLFLAKELASDGITVNAVAPGPIAVPMRERRPLPKSIVDLVPVGRMGTPAEVANAVLFLASESSSFITGEILDVNGGLYGD